MQNIFLFGSKRKFFETSTYYPQIFPPAGLAGYGGERKKKKKERRKKKGNVALNKKICVYEKCIPGRK